MKMSFEQFAELCGKVVYALDRNMNSAEAQKWIDDPNRRVVLASSENVIPEVYPASAPPTQYPANDTVFTLTISKPFIGLEMVRRFGYNPTGWKFNGTEIITPQTKKFMLVPIGEQPNLKAVKSALAQYGAIPAGQWCDAFKKAFLQPDGNGPIGVADSSWVSPRGNAIFPHVPSDGDVIFDWSAYDFHAHWRWLVEVQA